MPAFTHACPIPAPCLIHPCPRLLHAYPMPDPCLPLACRPLQERYDYLTDITRIRQMVNTYSTVHNSTWLGGGRCPTYMPVTACSMLCWRMSAMFTAIHWA
jgi:hypothetical protein